MMLLKFRQLLKMKPGLPDPNGLLSRIVFLQHCLWQICIATYLGVLKNIEEKQETHSWNIATCC